MTYHSTFALNLSRQRISLGIISSTKKQEILDSFDPNEPAGNQSLKRLFFLAKALSRTDPIVEVFLPDDVIHYETFISENTPTSDQVRSVLAERKNLLTSDIQVTLGENVGSRAISIAFTENAIMEELTNFITKAGFKIKCFRPDRNIVGFNGNNKLFPEYNLKKRNKFSNHLNLKYASVAILFLFCAFFFMHFQTDFYRNWIIAKSPSPTVNTNLEFHKLKHNAMGKGSADSSLENFSFPPAKKQGKDLFLSRKASSNLWAFKQPQKEVAPNFLKHLPPFLVSKTELWLRENNLDQNHIEALDFNGSKLVQKDTQKVLKIYQPTLEISNLLKPYDDDSLTLPSLEEQNLETGNSTEPLTVQTESSVNETSTDVARLESLQERNKIEEVYIEYVENSEKKPVITEVTESSTVQTESSANETSTVVARLVSLQERNKIEEVYIEYVENSEKKPVITEAKAPPPELEPMAMEYASKLAPYNKPPIIDSIRILSEPTLSTGALVFLESPLARPTIIIESKRIKPTAVNISARATKSPSIPKEVSVWHNSTKTNFIDLDRTNLIGIFGKTSNPSALVRLSNGKILTLKVGERFEGWRVFAIDRDKIHVENGSRQETLHLPG